MKALLPTFLLLFSLTDVSANTTCAAEEIPHPKGLLPTLDETPQDTTFLIPGDTVNTTRHVPNDNTSENSPLVRILPVSPQAAALARYGEYPVSLATGVPQITIPVYTVELGEYTMPVSLAYHASGIKVDDVASTVGLGWSLDCGGVITRQAFGALDRQRSDIDKTYYEYDRTMALADDYGMRHNEAAAMTLNELVFGKEGRWRYDSMSDRYTFNFAGKTGVFLYSYADDRYVPVNYSGMLVETDGYGLEQTFRIVDTDGTEYVFAQQECSGAKSEEHTAETSAWYLTAVNTPRGSVKIDYAESAEYETCVYDEALYVGYFGHYIPGTGLGEGGSFKLYNDKFYNGYRSKCLFKTPVVSAVSWNGNKLSFVYRDDREDIWKTRLTEIAVVNRDGDTIKTVTLDNAHYWGSTPDNKRMILGGLHFSDTGEYRMEYDISHGEFPGYGTGLAEGLLSFGEKRCSTDYWGYYNGRNDKTSVPREALACALRLYPMDKPQQAYFKLEDMADRNPDARYAQLGTIRSVEYPTGGKTTFEFEGNGPGYGGLRVKSVRSTDACGKPLLEKTYSYSDAFSLTDSPVNMTAYGEYHFTNIIPAVSSYHKLDSHMKCCGNPCLPTVPPAVFYGLVKETSMNGEAAVYEYDAYTERGKLCGQYVTGENPFGKYPHRNDYGSPEPYLTSKTVLDSSGSVMKKETRTYSVTETKTFSAGCAVTSLLKNATTQGKWLSPQIKVYFKVKSTDTISITNRNVVEVEEVTAHCHTVFLTEKETTDFTTGVTTRESYTYDPQCRTLAPKSVTVSNSDGKIHTRLYTYAFDLDDNFHRSMAANYYVCDTPVETREFCNGTETAAEFTEFTEHGNWIYPHRILRSLAGGTPYETYRFDNYDSHGNPTRIIANTTDTDSLEWGYGGMYPTRHLHNGILMAEYSWKPLRGVSSVKKPNGYAEDYGYDDGGRLSSVGDAWGTRKKFFYSYANSQGNGSGDNQGNAGNCVKTTNILSADGTCSNVTMQYADGLGRPSDTASDGIDENGGFVHSFSSYDSKGRKEREWLPVVSTGGSEISDESELAALSVRTYNDNAAYSDMTSDALDRTVFSSTPGAQWQGKGKSTAYAGNRENDVKLYQAPADKISLEYKGYYSPNTLAGETTTDEDGHCITVFTDKLGRKVLERRNDGSRDIDTYFVYNDLGQLRYVLSPEYQNAGYKDKYAYEYRYDERGNVVKKILPSCEPAQYWYDRGNRMAFMQDATLRDRGLYRFFLYDRLGRLAVQGTSSSCDRGEDINTAEFAENSGGWHNTGYNIPLSGKVTNASLETVNYYDGYEFLRNCSAELGNLASDFRVKGSCAQGLQTGRVQTASNGSKVVEAFFYDGKGQVTDTRRLCAGKRLTCIHTDHSYTGKPARAVTEEYSVDGGGKRLTATVIRENTYSGKTDRLLSSSLSVNGRKQDIQRIEYDGLGRVKSVARGGKAGCVSYAYDLHGWTTGIEGKDFREELHYADGAGTPLFNGNVSSLLWSAPDYGQTRGYKFGYDGMDRLTEAVYGETPSLSDKANRYNEKVVEYTANGSIRRFQRRGLKNDGEYGKIDNLNIRLDGNRLLSVTDDAKPANRYSSFNFIDGADEETEYTYNGVGALTQDLNRGMTIAYDNLNNPRRIDFRDGNSITYTYLPDGTLIGKGYGQKALPSKSAANILMPDSLTAYSGQIAAADTVVRDRLGMVVTGGTEYSGNMVYQNGKLDKVLFPGGYCTFAAGAPGPVFHYFTRDHLGSNRAVTNEDGTVEQIVHYYPFGGTFNDAGLNASLQQYKYNGKELDRIAGLNTYDYGARQYFPALPGWDRMDMLCEEDYHISPYVYCKNNPIKFIDKDGKRPGDFFLTMDAAAIDFGLFYNDNSIRENREYGTFIYKVTNKHGVSGYSYSIATIGGKHSINIGAAPNGHIPCAVIHTHAGSTYRNKHEFYDNEFSGIRNDGNLKNNVERKNTKTHDLGYSNKLKLVSYLVTPNGSLKKYDYKTGKIKVISNSMPSDSKDPNRLNGVRSNMENNYISDDDFLRINRKIMYEDY